MRSSTPRLGRRLHRLPATPARSSSSSSSALPCLRFDVAHRQQSSRVHRRLTLDGAGVFVGLMSFSAQGASPALRLNVARSAAIIAAEPIMNTKHIVTTLAASIALLAPVSAAVDYTAVGDWLKLPDGRTQIGGMHGDIAVSSRGEVYV